MTDPASSAAPIATMWGLGIASFFMGLDPAGVLAAFGGALLFSFMAKDTPVSHRVLGLTGALIFGYYAAQEIVRRKIWGFESPPLPAFVSAFFCVALFKLLLVLFNEEGRAWVRKKLGLNPEGGRGD